jgi:hypothetical protein
MQTFFAWLVKTVLIDFLWNKLVLGYGLLLRWIEEYKKRGEIVKDNDQQAALVESIAAEIRKLIEAGLPVPKELSDRLKAESRKLIDGTNNTD